MDLIQQSVTHKKTSLLVHVSLVSKLAEYCFHNGEPVLMAQEASAATGDGALVRST